MMILLNEMEKQENISKKDFELFLQILAPFAPHITEEIWHSFGNKNSIHISTWPKWDPKLIKDEQVKIVVQINGKVRAEMLVGVDTTEEEIKKQALENEAVVRNISGQEIKKVIYVKNRLINIVC